jgi:hypothetical protein
VTPTLTPRCRRWTRKSPTVRKGRRSERSPSHPPAKGLRVICGIHRYLKLKTQPLRELLRQPGGIYHSPAGAQHSVNLGLNAAKLDSCFCRPAFKLLPGPEFISFDNNFRRVAYRRTDPKIFACPKPIFVPQLPYITQWKQNLFFNLQRKWNIVKSAKRYLRAVEVELLANVTPQHSHAAVAQGTARESVALAVVSVLRTRRIIWSRPIYGSQCQSRRNSAESFGELEP